MNRRTVRLAVGCLAAADDAQWVSMLESFERQWARSIGAFPRGRWGEVDTLDTALPEAALFSKALSLAQNGRRAASLAWVQRAIELRPKSSAAHRTLAQVQLISGDTVQARQAFQRALELARSATDSAATRKASGTLLGPPTKGSKQ